MKTATQLLSATALTLGASLLSPARPGPRKISPCRCPDRVRP